MNARLWLAILFAGSGPILAAPPMQVGDVPPADRGVLETFVGVRYQKSETGRISRLLPHAELTYGITNRWEATLEFDWISEREHHGLGDCLAGTKILLLGETAHLPGIAISGDCKLPTGDEERGLGSGEADYAVRLRAQKTWGWFTLIGNAGHMWLTEPTAPGGRASREDTWFLGLGQEYKIGPRTKLLSEILWRSREEPGDANRFAANVGFKHKLTDDFSIHAAIGGSLREHAIGGPELRIYAGVKYELGLAPKR